ncbi:BCL-2-associated athanogene 5 [Euphorbia peplus]|nr:BCL-2-associated athanogene 5 [Euphorbia peplus]
MNNPFYRNHYYPARQIPVPSRRETKPARKVINVPVTDGSEKRSRSREDSAVKIQKMLRGFMVRKNVKRIVGIKAEVDEMEKRISETVELIKTDRKERLKVNEMLMRLLLKLDSVPGVDFGVRECRKGVIKKAIRLQEVVDSISDDSIHRMSDSSQSDRNPNSNSNLKNDVEFEKKIESEDRDVPEAMAVEGRRSVAEENAPEIEADVAKSASESDSISNSPENNADQNRELQPGIEGNAANSASESNLNLNSKSLANDVVNQKLQLQNDVELEKNFESEVGDIPEAMDVEPRKTLGDENAHEVDAANSTSEPRENDDDQNHEKQLDAPEAVDLKLQLQNNVDSKKDRDVPEAMDVENRRNAEEAEELAVEIHDDVAKSASENTPENNLNWNCDFPPDAVECEVPIAKAEPVAMEDAESMDLSQDESQTGSSADDPDEHEESDSETCVERGNGEEIERNEGKGGDDGKNIKLLEKLVEDNEKMMGLMADLFKKNEMQTQLLSSLSNRVEHLERVFMSRRKKRRN